LHSFLRLHLLFHTSFSRLNTPPKTLDDLSNSINLLETLKLDMPKTEQQFEPIHDQFNILRKYEVQVSEEAELKLSKLQPSWMAFQQCLIDSEGMLEKYKVRGVW